MHIVKAVNCFVRIRFNVSANRGTVVRCFTRFSCVDSFWKALLRGAFAPLFLFLLQVFVIPSCFFLKNENETDEFCPPKTNVMDMRTFSTVGNFDIVVLLSILN